MKIDLILPRPDFVQRAFRLNAHLFQRQTDFPADILSLVLRSHVHIARPVIGNFCRLSVFVQFQQIKLHFRAEIKSVTLSFRVPDRLFQNPAGIRLKRRAVCMGNVAEHMGHPSMLGPPGKLHQRRRVRMQQKVRIRAEAVNGRGVNRNAPRKGSCQFPRLNRHIFMTPVNVAKRHTDKFHVLFFDVLHHFFRGVLHKFCASIFPASVRHIHLLIWIFAVRRDERIGRSINRFKIEVKQGAKFP